MTTMKQTSLSYVSLTLKIKFFIEEFYDVHFRNICSQFQNILVPNYYNVTLIYKKKRFLFCDYSVCLPTSN